MVGQKLQKHKRSEQQTTTGRKVVRRWLLTVTFGSTWAGLDSDRR